MKYARFKKDYSFIFPSLPFFLLVALVLFSIGACNTTKKKVSNQQGMQKVMPEQFGAKGDGRTDDTEAFRRAFAALQSGGTLQLGGRKYLVRNSLGTLTKPVSIEGRAETVIVCPKGFVDFQNTPYLGNISLPSLSQNTQRIPVRNLPRNVKVGDVVFFTSAELFEERVRDYKKEHANEIVSISGNELVLRYPVGFSFHQPVTLTFYPKATFAVKQVQFESGIPLNILTAAHASRVELDKVSFTTSDKRLYGIYPSPNLIGTSGISLYGCTNVVATECRFDYVWYGLLAHRGCTKVDMNRCTAFKSHHINNSALGTDLFQLTDCTTKECESGYDSHETAMGLTLLRCKDLGGTMASILRGRRDRVEDCFFENGIWMKYDVHSLPLFKEGVVEKTCLRTVSTGIINYFEGANVWIDQCTFSQAVVFASNYGNQRILRSTFEEKSTLKPKRSEILTIGDKGWDDASYTFLIENCTIKAAAKSIYPLGIYLPMTGKAIGTLRNVSIEGFEKGLTLYGGAPALPYYKQLSLENVTIKNCELGVYQSPIEIQLRKKDIQFQQCRTDMERPSALKVVAAEK